MSTLSQLPNYTLLFLDGSTVIQEAQNIELKKEGCMLEPDGHGQPINVSGNIGSKGIIKWGDKEFPFRGWTITIGQLSMLGRYDLAYWICQSFNPPFHFPLH